jgi:hypothetical protein
MELVMQTQRDRAAQDPDTEKRKIYDAFASIGVGPDKLKEYVGHELDALQPAEIVSLRGLYAAIKDEETTFAAAMEAKGKKDTATTSVFNTVKKPVPTATTAESVGNGQPEAKTPPPSPVPQEAPVEMTEQEARKLVNNAFAVLPSARLRGICEGILILPKGNKAPALSDAEALAERSPEAYSKLIARLLSPEVSEEIRRVVEN